MKTHETLAELQKQIRSLSFWLCITLSCVVTWGVLIYWRLNDLGEINLNIAKIQAESTAEYMKLLLKGDDE